MKGRGNMKKIVFKQYEEELKVFQQQIDAYLEKKGWLERVLNESKKEETFDEIRMVTVVNEIEEYYEDVESGRHLDEHRLFFEVETDQTTMLVMLDYVREESYSFHRYFWYRDKLYRLIAPNMNEENINQLVKLLVEKIEHTLKGENESVYVIHPYQESYKRKVLTEEENQHYKKLAKEHDGTAKKEIDKFWESFEK